MHCRLANSLPTVSLPPLQRSNLDVNQHDVDSTVRSEQGSESRRGVFFECLDLHVETTLLIVIPICGDWETQIEKQYVHPLYEPQWYL